MTHDTSLATQLMEVYIDGLINNNPELFENIPKKDTPFYKTWGLTLYAMKTFLDLSWEEAADTMTDGGNDLGIDAIHYTCESHGKLLITVCQTKYSQDLQGDKTYPENSVLLVANTISYIFDSLKGYTANDRLRAKIEEIYSLLSEGNIPVVQVLFCNNGKKWNDSAQNHIDELQKKYGDHIRIIYYNHENIFSVLSQTATIDERLKFQGKIIIEDMNYLRVLIGKVSCKEIARIFKSHGDNLLERNVRKYLGQTNNRVNQAIAETLSGENANNFYFYNNGVTLICDKLEYNPFSSDDAIVKLYNMQVINGGQTCRTIMETYENPNLISPSYHPCVLVRVYQMARDQEDMVEQITYATNNQNPVDLRDLHSNDKIQKQLTEGLKHLGYTYKPKRDDLQTKTAETIPSTVLAESVLSIWCRKPYLAKFYRNELFGRFYTEIFGKLTPAQAALAVLIFRYAESERKKAEKENRLQNSHFIPYASHYIAMLLGDFLLRSAHLSEFSLITHKNFDDLRQDFERNKENYYRQAVERIQKAISQLYGQRKNLSLQQLSATFRRCDLMEFLR